MSTATKKARPRGGKKTSRRPRPFLWLALALLLVGLISIFWHRPTRIQLELETARLAFTLGGEKRREVLNPSVPFSSLVIEDCSTVGLNAQTLEVADPQQLVPGAGVGETPHFPGEAWSKVQFSNPVTLSCRDPAAKLTLRHPDPAAAQLGILDRIRLAPGSQAILAISPGQEPALSLEIETPQNLTLPLGPDLEFVTDFIEPKDIVVPFPGDLLTWRARLAEAHRMLEITSGKHGLVLIVTPARDQAAELFPEMLDLPLASMELLEEDLEGTLTSPLRDKATLSYPEYPTVPAVIIEKGEAVGLGGLSKANLRSLELDHEKGALRVSFDGIVEHATSKSGEFSRDYRLTLFKIVRYNWPLALIAAAASLLSIILGVVDLVKKLREWRRS